METSFHIKGKLINIFPVKTNRVLFIYKKERKKRKNTTNAQETFNNRLTGTRIMLY